MIEFTGAVPAAIAPATVPTDGDINVRNHRFKVGRGWKDQKFGQLIAALGRLPDSVLQEADGITFSLRDEEGSTPGEAGKFDPVHDEIVMHNNAFPASSTTYGGGDIAMLLITHEVGHLLDLRRWSAPREPSIREDERPLGKRSFSESDRFPARDTKIRARWVSPRWTTERT